jgi:HK97 family phage prohead protease
MPVPQKENNETDKDFIVRCVQDDFMKEYDDIGQRLAICYAQIEEEEERQTNFPNKGDDKKISLRNSEEPQFDYDFALNIKEQTPEIWSAGGNIRGNEAFMLWGRARDGQDTEAIREWIKERESWIKRHFEDGKQFEGDTEPNLSNVGGVVAQIKWGTIGTLGEQGMKDVILELTKKLEGKKEENQVSDDVKKGLENKVKEHNEEVQELDLSWDGSVNLSTLEKVFERGVGAYNTNPSSVRPQVQSSEQWAYARVNSFLFALKKGRFQGGKHDTDLLPSGHPVKEEMEEKYTNMKNKEIRTIQVQDLEVRMDGDKPKVIGYASVFGSLSNDLGGFREYIGKDAFEGRLDDDVRFLINHDGLPLARTTNGTLKLSVDEKGLKYEAEMPDTTDSRDLMELLKNGTVNQSSFAFIVEEDSWEMNDGQNIRTIEKISRLFDVSAVTYPAYEEATSSVALRSLDNWNKQKENLKKEKQETKKEEQDLFNRSLAKLRLEVLKYKSY